MLKQESGTNLSEANQPHNILYKLGIDQITLGLLPEEPLEITQFAPDCFICETKNHKMAIWIHYGHESTLAKRHQLVRLFEFRGLPTFLYPLLLKDQRTYVSLDGRRCLYITHWPEMRRVLFSNVSDLIALVNLLIEFRKTAKIVGVHYLISERKENPNLLNKYYTIIDALNSFALLAKYRLKPTRFDQLFLEYYPKAILQTEKSLKLLTGSDYQYCLANLTTQDLIIDRLVRNNLKILLPDTAICLRYRDIRQDLPIVDLGTLLIKVGRSVNWSLNIFNQMVELYQRFFIISESEQKILGSYLTCPWHFYRIAARYYYNRADWSFATYTDRLERILGDEPDRITLLSNMPQFLPACYNT